MKRKNDILYLTFLIVMLVMIGIGYIKLSNSDQKTKQYLIEEYEKVQEKCKSFAGRYETEDQKKFCETSKEDFIKGDNTFQYKFDQLVEAMPLSVFGFIPILIVIACSTFYICRYLKCNFIQYDLNRAKYADIKSKMIKDGLKPALVLPILVVILGIISYLYTGNLLIETEASNSSFLYCVAVITKCLLNCLVYCNVSIIVARKQHNWILAAITSFLVVLGLELFLELFVGSIICFKILGLDIGIIFNILDCKVFYDYGLLPSLAVPMAIVIITACIITYLYKDRETLVIDCEANN